MGNGEMRHGFAERRGVLGRAGLRRVGAAIGSISVVAASLALQASPASAAPGDIASSIAVPPSPARSNDIVVGPDGNLWTISGDDRSISAISQAGALIGTYPLTGTPSGVAAGADGLWVSYFDRPYLSRVATSGSINLNCNTRGTGASDIAIGSDAVYFSDASTGNIGRMTIRRGTVFTCEESTLSTSGLSAGRLSAGPSGTGKLYVQYPSNNYGIVTVPAQVRNYVLASMSALSDVQTVGQEAWFLGTNTAGDRRLLRLVNDVTIVDLQAPVGMDGMAPAAGGGAWLLDVLANKVALADPAGVVQVTYRLPAAPLSAVVAPEGSLWIRTASSVLRMLTGQVPTIRTAPGLGPTSGVSVGTRVTSTYGEWNYSPTAFAFQWQRCTANDPATCTNIPAATGQSYIPTTTDPYLRAGVTAYNPNGLSAPAYTALLPIAGTTTPGSGSGSGSGTGSGSGSGTGSGTGSGSGSGSSTPAPATGPDVTVGAGIIASLDGPPRLRRGVRGIYEVTLSTTTATGRVTFTFTRGTRTRTVPNVPVTNGEATTNWRVPRSWPRGATTIRATYTPTPGTTLTPGNMLIRTAIR